MRSIRIGLSFFFIAGLFSLPTGAQTPSVIHYCNNVIASIAPLGDTVYCLTNWGTILYDIAAKTEKRIGEGTDYYHKIVVSDDGILWAYDDDLLKNYVNGEWNTYSLPTEYNATSIKNITPFQSNGLIVSIIGRRRIPGCEGHGCWNEVYTLACYLNGEWTLLDSYETEYDPFVGYNYLSSSGNNNTAFAARHGSIYLITSDNSDSVQVISFPEMGTAKSILKDQDGDIWLIFNKKSESMCELWKYPMDTGIWEKRDDDFPLFASQYYGFAGSDLVRNKRGFKSI